MSHFICPVCGSSMWEDGNTCRCQNGHSYDRAKSGYLNLLMSQNKKEKRHGDDKAMVLARTRFLEAGHYQPLLDALQDTVRCHGAQNGVLLDLGCGEGFYSDHICRALAAEGWNISLLGVDISKEAVKAFSKREFPAQLAVASAFKAPVETGNCNIVLSVFAPLDPAEVRRILAPGGVLIRAYPLEKHLLSLKQLVYDQVYENKPPVKDLPGLTLKETRTVKGSIHLDTNEDIRNLFMMTPYFYKTSRAGQEKLLSAARLDTEIEFGIDVYRTCPQVGRDASPTAL